MSRPRSTLSDRETQRARCERAAGKSWREVGRLLGRDYRLVQRVVGGLVGEVDGATAAAAALIPVQRQPEPPRLPINAVTASQLAVARHAREHGCCMCGEVAPAGRIDTSAHAPCSGLVVRSRDGLGLAPA